MKIQSKLWFYCLILLPNFVLAQVTPYNYHRPIIDVKDQWHRIVLPDDIFEHSHHNLNDIRVIGISPNNDTTESPYFATIKEDKLTHTKHEFNLINQSHNDAGYYYTFQRLSNDPINRLELSFHQNNFDWLTTLEGSADGINWSTIKEDQRILSIQNTSVDYHFTTLYFPMAMYPYLRLCIKSDVQPSLNQATIIKHNVSPGVYRTYPSKVKNKQKNQKHKTTTLEVVLQRKYPVSQLRFSIGTKQEYHRPISIRYVIDSNLLDNKVNYSYRTVFKGVLSSLAENKIEFPITHTNRMLIEVSNHDNIPLQLDSIIVQGPEFELVARFDGMEKDYYLTYGKANISAPNYDIKYFKDRIPENITPLSLGEEMMRPADDHLASQPLFKSKWWLWLVMIITIAALGWFSFSMLNQKNT